MGLTDFALIVQYRTAAINAMVAGDYATAIQQAMAAQAVLGTIPSKASRSAGTFGGAQSAEWPADQIQAFIINCQRLQNAAGGVTLSNKQYQPPQLFGSPVSSPGEYY
jgi:hypothetical protein